MLRSKFEILRAEKEFNEQRKITLRTIADETGLSLGAVYRFSSGQLEKMQLSTVITLCRYFGVSSINDLVEYSDEDEPQHSAPKKVKKAAA